MAAEFFLSGRFRRNFGLANPVPAHPQVRGSFETGARPSGCSIAFYRTIAER
jgi:hypothetical protein